MSLGTIPKFPMLLTLLSLLLLLFDLSALKTEVTVISKFTKLPTLKYSRVRFFVPASKLKYLKGLSGW